MVDNLSYLSGGTVSIDQPDQEQSYTIDSSNPFIQLPYNAETAQGMAARAARAAMGQKDKTNLDQDKIQDSINNGQEGQLRQQAAAQIDSSRMASAMPIADKINDPQVLANLFKPNDPDTVFEKYYALEHMQHLDWPKDPTKAAQDTPLYYNMVNTSETWDYLTKNLGSPILALKDFMRTVKQYSPEPGTTDVVRAVAADLVTLGFYGELRPRQGGVLSEGALLGTNLQNQAWRLYSRATTDFEGAKNEVYSTYKNLAQSDPSTANRWLDAMIGQGSDERSMNNLFTVLNVGGVLASLKPGSIRSVVGMLKAVPDTVPPEVAAAAMAGNIKDSAIKNVLKQNIDQFKGSADLLDFLKQRLPGIYDIDKAAASADVSRLGREMSNRISDITDSAKNDFLDAIMNALRVNKTPAAVTMESRIKQIEAGLADQNRGIDNQVINVRYHSYLPASNVHLFEVQLGTHDGDLFRSLDELESNAKMNGLIKQGDIIKEADLVKKGQLDNLVRAWETQIKTATTPEGIARAQAGAQLIRDQISQLPRHETGYTIGKATLPYDEDIARWEGEGGATIEQQGNGYYISKVIPLRPDQSFVRDGLITTQLNTLKEFRAAKAKEAFEPSTSIPLFTNWRTGWINAVMGRARNPAERLSITENAQRVIATHGPSVLLGLGEKTLKPIKKVPRKDWEPFNRMTKFLQKDFNEETKTPGRWLDTPSEVNNWFQTYVGRDAHPNTIDAYFALKNLGTHDLNLRDLIVGQRKMEYGFGLNNIKYTDVEGKAAETGFFEGARQWEMPDDFKNIMITGTDKNSTKVYRSKFVPAKIRGELQADITKGKAKLVRVADPKKRPMGDLSPKRIEYVVAYGDKHQEKPISPVGHVNRLGGGHLMPEWDWFLKQAHVDEGVYEGDKTILNFMSRAQAREAIPAMERVREAFRKYKASAEGKLSEADRRDIERFKSEDGAVGPAFLDDAIEANKATGIPFWKHYDWYFGKNKLLDLNEPIHVVQRDQKIMDHPVDGQALKDRHRRIEVDQYGNKHKIHLVDGTRGEGSLLGKAMVPFTQDRDAEGIWTLRNKGTQQNPIFAYEPAPYVDPIVAAERAYSRIARTMYMSDMQDFSREHWLEQAHPYLQTDTTDTQRDIRENPLKHFFDPIYKKGTAWEIRNQLEANRKQAIEFSGARNDVQLGIREIGQKLADSIYNKFGANPVTMWLMSELPKKRDPVGVIRNWVFNPVLGLFSLPSMFTQISTFGNVLAISPKQAPRAAIASMLYGISKLNRTPEMWDHLDNLASQMGWRSGDFKEFVNLMESTGFHRTGNEHAFASNALGDKVLTKGFMTLLDWGRLPFNLGAGFTKIGGFATAYLEHRAVNPFGKIGQQELSSILQRSALLDHNMSSAFSTKLHTGAMSIPMQFQAYDLRLSEMMLGKNLTPAEKARLFTMSAMMYGAVGGGLTVVGFPIANYLTKTAETQMGYIPGENPLGDLAMAGIPATIMKYITGQGDYTKGTLYNVSKWGNKGIDPFEQILAEDKPLRDIIGGVAGNVFYNTLQDSYGLRAWIRSKAIGDNGERPITLDDILDNFNEISTIRNTRKLFYAVNNGKQITKNEGRVQDISRFNALVSFVTGLAPQPGTDTWIKQKIIKEADDEIIWHENYISKLMGRALTASENKDDDSFKKYMRQVEAELQTYIPLEKQHQALSKAIEQFSQNQKDRINYELYFKTLKQPDMYRRSMQR